MKGLPEELDSDFLRDVRDPLHVRSKALRYRSSSFRCDRGDWKGLENLDMEANSADGTMELSLDARNVAHQYIRSHVKANRGKILLRVEKVLLPGNGQSVVRVIERTLEILGNGLGSPRGLQEIESLWIESGLRRVE